MLLTWWQAPNRSTPQRMEFEPSETQFMATLGRDSSEEDTKLEQDDTRWRPSSFEDYEQFFGGEIFSMPTEDRWHLASLCPSPPRSLPVFNFPSPLCSEFDPIGLASSERIEAADAGSNRPALDLKDSDYVGGECGPVTPVTRQLALEVASQAKIVDLWLEFQRLMDVASQANTVDLGLVFQRLMDVASPTNTVDLGLVFQRYMDVVGLEALLKTDPAISATLGGCPPELGGLELLIGRNAVRSEPSQSNSTGAKYNACTKGPKRRHRSPKWTDEEKDAYLEVKIEAQTAVEGKDWDFISEVLKDRHAFIRSPKSCEDLWGTLLKSFKVIRHHESMDHSSNWSSYWDLDENGRSERQLPKSFSFKWYKMIESILAGKGKRAAGDQQWTTKDPGQTSLGGAGEYSGSLLRLADELINKQLRDLPETSTSNTLTMSKEGLGPYVQNVVIDVLQSALEPLATILQHEHEEKEEFDAKMKDLDKKRRALDLEEIQIKRQRVGRYQRTRRSTCRPKQHAGLPVEKASEKKIIPAFKELNIAMAQELIDLHDSKELTNA